MMKKVDRLELIAGSCPAIFTILIRYITFSANEYGMIELVRKKYERRSDIIEQRTRMGSNYKGCHIS